MKYTASLKIKQTEVPAQVLMYLKKITGEPLCEMQKRLRNRDYLIKLDLFELESIELINQMRRDLMEFDLDVELYEGGELVEPELFKNLENSYRDTREKIANMPFYY